VLVGAFGRHHPGTDRRVLLGPRPGRARRLWAAPSALDPPQSRPATERVDVTDHHDRAALLHARTTRATPVAVRRGLYRQLDFAIDVTRLKDADTVDSEHNNSTWASLRWHLELSENSQS
jgi:hypothetical protein